MLQIITSLKQLNFRQLCNVYTEELWKAGKEQYRYLNENLQLLEAEQDFYQFLTDFLKQPESFYALWTVRDCCQAALRIEPYRDGVLLTGLQTAPDSRQKGYATSLITNTISYLSDHGVQKVYSHIRNDNVPSVKVHQKCGFSKIMDHAAYIDGSVDFRSATYLYII